MWFLFCSVAISKPFKKDGSTFVTGKFGYAMRKVEPGTFNMGSDESDPRREKDEIFRSIQITRPFYIGKTEVTIKLWKMITDEDPSKRDGSNCYRTGEPIQATDDFPASCIDWYEVVRFANTLSTWETLEACYQITGDMVIMPKGLDCSGYRLPTEAEWEYAARGGAGELSKDEMDVRKASVPVKKRRGKNRRKKRQAVAGHRLITLYAGSDKVERFGWYAENSENIPHRVATKKANELGVFDMSGNVWEWTWDWYGSYLERSQKDPTGNAFGTERVLRGGSWANGSTDLRLGNRFKRNPTHRNTQLGFRLVRTVKQ